MKTTVKYGVETWKYNKNSELKLMPMGILEEIGEMLKKEEKWV